MRAYCKHCHYPVSTCVCSAINTVSVDLGITVIQHPKEASHAKNTVKLLQLCMPHIEVVSSTDQDGIRDLQLRCDSQSSAVIYPNQNSCALESIPKHGKSQLQHIILLDGSWRQAFGIMQQHQWLQALPSYHFDDPHPSEYRIRHTSVTHALSTLEAAAFCISKLRGINVSTLYRAQEKLQSFWQGPPSHRRGANKH